MLESTQIVINARINELSFPTIEELSALDEPTELLFGLHPSFMSSLNQEQLVEEVSSWLETIPYLFEDAEVAGIFLEMLVNAFDAIIVRQSEDPNYSNPLIICYLAQDSKYYHGACADNGCGIPDDIRTQIFHEAFFPSPKKAYTDIGVSLLGGAGQGMHIAHTDIVAMGGSIEFNDFPNGGTVFGFKAPNSL